MTGPGSLKRGASESESVPWIATRSQSNEPDAPSIRQIHIEPPLESIVVRTIAVVLESKAAQAGEDGCVPLSSVTSHSASVGALVVKPNESTVGSLVDSSTTASTNSGRPSKAKSATRG